jgi:hypothetical protein
MNKFIFPTIISFLILFIVISAVSKNPRPLTPTSVPPLVIKKINYPTITASSSIIVLHRGNESRVLYQKDAER